MSIERQKLREELVAVIGAGRELSPEHDHALADLYLDLALQERRPQPEPYPGDVSHWIRMTAAAVCLAAAALIFSLLALHENHPETTMYQSVPIPRLFDPDRSQGRSGQWWGPDGGDPGFRNPQSPSS